MAIHLFDPPLQGARLEFLAPGDEGRGELERFIHDTYARAYGADLRRFLPLLIGLRDRQGRPLAAMGIRAARDERLLLEHYLDAPVEEVIAERRGVAVARDSVVELGNLAVAHAGAARWMIVALNAYLGGAGFQWVTLTAVPALRNAFARLDLPLTPLAEADGARLGEERAVWGRYYETHPVVMAGDISEGFDRLTRAMRLEQAYELLRGMWERALAAGLRTQAAA